MQNKYSRLILFTWIFSCFLILYRYATRNLEPSVSGDYKKDCLRLVISELFLCVTKLLNLKFFKQIKYVAIIVY